MPKLGINLSMLFTEIPMMERFSAARNAGFNSIEIQFPYEFDRKAIKQELQRNELEMILFNMHPGDVAAGDCGIASLPSRVDEFRATVQKAVDWATDLGVSRLNCLAGKRVSSYSYEEQWETLVSNVRYAARILEQNGIQLMIEPLNHYDVPGFLLNTPTQVLQLINEVNSANVYLQYDIYHAQREEGKLTETLRLNLAKIGHIQIADNPGRHQPGTGEINYRYLLQEIDRSGYQGYVSLEYLPQPDTLTSLNWLKDLGIN
ncbi:Hydroxypyruvate isomerase [Sporomusa carbonis]